VCGGRAEAEKNCIPWEASAPSGSNHCSRIKILRFSFKIFLMEFQLKHF